MEWIVGEFVRTLRSLRRNPVFGGIVIATLALVMGGTEATSTRNRGSICSIRDHCRALRSAPLSDVCLKGVIFGKVELLRPPREGATQPAWCNAISTGA